MNTTVQLPPPREPLWKDIVAALAVAIFSSWFFAQVTHQWDHPARYPRVYQGDYAVYLTWVQTMIEEGTYLHNSRVGRPLGTDWRGFPTSDGWLNWQVIRALTLIKPEPGWVMNWFYWLTFPLTAISAFAALRVLRFTRLVAIGGAILFNFLPYHHLRHEHVFMTAYYLVPWSLIACLQYRDGSAHLGRWNRATAGHFVLALLTGIGYIYYAYFANILMLSTGIWRAFRDRSWQPLVVAVLWCSVVMAVLLATLIAEIRYKRTAPFNPDMVTRVPSEAEVYGFQITQLVMPVPDHHIQPFALLRQQYRDWSPLVNENETGTLGAIPAIGLLALLLGFVFRRSRDEGTELIQLLAMVVFLLAVVGGFGSLINWTEHALGINPWIRSYNRISVFLGFLCILFWANWGQVFWQRFGRWPTFALVLVMLAIGLFDQTPRNLDRNFEKNQKLFRSDVAFFPQVEADAADGAMVYIMNYRYYPECPIWPFSDYSLFRPYIHTRHLTYNYGALENEPNDVWNRHVAYQPTAKLLETLTEMEAHGLLIFRPSDEDGAKKLEAEARAILKIQPLISDDEQFVFFPLKQYIAEMKSRVPAAQWQERLQKRRSPLSPVCRKGFSRSINSTMPIIERYFVSESTIHVTNHLDQPRPVQFKFTVRVSDDQPIPENSVLRVVFGSKEVIITLNGKSKEVVTQDWTFPPGESTIRFTPAATREDLTATKRSRTVWMTIGDVHIIED